MKSLVPGLFPGLNNKAKKTGSFISKLLVWTVCITTSNPLFHVKKRPCYDWGSLQAIEHKSGDEKAFRFPDALWEKIVQAFAADNQDLVEVLAELNDSETFKREYLAGLNADLKPHQSGPIMLIKQIRTVILKPKLSNCSNFPNNKVRQPW